MFFYSTIGWLSLFILFSLMFIMMNIMNYYMIIYKSTYKLITSKNKNNNIHWTW